MKSLFQLNKGIRAVAALGALLLAACSMAGPVDRAGSLVNINAGVLVVNSNLKTPTLPDDPTPYAFLVLDRCLLAKPAGWNFVNPYSAGTMSAAAWNRWSALVSIYGGTAVPAVGSLLNKQTGAYWEVPLDNMSSAQMNQYNILLLPAYDALSLNPKERGLIQSFVDHGGVLWVDTAPGMFADAANGVPGASFVSTDYTSSPGQQLIYNQQSPLLNYPFQIQGGYATFDGSSKYNAFSPVDLASAGFGSLIPILNTPGPEFSRFHSVVADPSNRPMVVYQRQGAGIVLVTSTRAAYAMGGGINGVGAVSPGNYTASAPNAQLIINAIYLGDQFSQADGTSRKTNSVPTDNGAPLIQAFKDELNGGSVAGQAPVEYKGLLFVSKGNQLYAYSARPGSDLDSNGFKDDGIQDWSLGKGADLVWVSDPQTGPISAPVAFTVPGLPGNSSDEVCVVDGQGNLVAFPAFPVNASGVFPTSGTVAPIYKEAPPTGSAVVLGESPLAPTFFNGLVYVADNYDNGGNTVGRIWTVSPRNAVTGGNAYVNDWCLGGSGQAVLNQPITASCTVGYIPIADASGGQDRVVYVPLGSTGSGGAPCGLASIWAGVVGEKHALQFDTTGDLIIQTRASQSNAPVYVPGGYDANGIRVVLYDANGNSLTVAQMNNYLSGAVTNASGVLVLPLKTGVSQATMAAAGITGVAVDYSLDWNYSNIDVRRVVRGVVGLPDDSDKAKQIVGSIALAPNGNLFLTESNPNSSSSNGTFFAIQEEGRGLFNVLTRWDLYSNYSIQNLQGGASDASFPPTLEDLDPIQSFAPAFLSGEFSKLTFVSGPAVSGNQVFVKARGFKAGFVPCSILMCFNANPPASRFTVPNTGGFSILQPDISRSSPADKSTPNVYTHAVGTQYTRSSGPNGTTFTFSSLSLSHSQLNQVLSQSLPVIIRQSGLPDEIFDPSENGAWNTLQWYTILHGVDDGADPQNADPIAATGAPVVTGNTVFMAGNSVIPAIFSGGNPLTAKPTGLLFGMTAEISSTDPYLVFNTNRRPYFHELNSLQVPSPGVISVNSDFKWPQIAGSTSFTVYLQRLFQTALGGSDTANPRQCFGIAAGNSGIYAYADTGIYGYRSADITVVDANRILTADTSGNAKWSSDQGDDLRDGTAIAINLSRVKTAHQISQTRWVYADPSSNSVGIIDRTGHSQSIRSFIVSPYFNGVGNVPPGYQAGENVQLSHPGDVVTYSNFASPDPYNPGVPISYLQHFLVADTGNHRIVDLVYDYPVDPTTHQIEFYTPTQPPFLFAQSDPLYTGKNFAYSSISLYQKSPTDQVIAASVPDGVQSASSLGFTATVPDPVTGASSPQVHQASAGNGMVLLIDGASTDVINSMTVPAIPANVLPDPVNGGFKPAQPAQTIPLGKVSSVDVAPVYDKLTGVTALTVMITNQDGVFELTKDTVSGNWDVDWMLPASVFRDMLRDGLGNNLPENPVDFRPVYARRTESGSVLIVNGYTGVDQGGKPYGGAVLEVDGSFAAAPGGNGFNFGSPYLGFNSISVQYQLPPIENGRTIEGPVFADRRF